MIVTLQGKSLPTILHEFNVVPIYVFVSEHYYNKSNLKLNEKSEDALSDFINNPQTLIIQGFMNNENIFLHSKVSTYLFLFHIISTLNIDKNNVFTDILNVRF